MKRWLPGLVLGLMLALPALAPRAAEPVLASGPLERVVTMQVQGSVEFNEQGQVTASQIDTQVLPALSQALQAKMAGWKFKPVVVDGVLRKARARVHLVLAASEVDGHYQVNLDSVSFPPPQSEPGQPRRIETAQAFVVAENKPRVDYPKDMLRSKVSAIVLVAVRIRADGSVADAGVVQSQILDMKGRDNEMIACLRQFERNVLRAARENHYQVQAKPGQTPGETTALVPYHFTIGDVKSPVPGEWRNVVRSPRRAIAWEQNGPAAPSVSGVDRSSLLALESAVQLDGSVAGQRIL